MGTALHKPGALILDMDGLMLDTESLYRWAWQQAASEMGYPMSDALYLSFIGRGLEECKPILVHTYGNRFPLADFLKRSLQLCHQRIAELGIPVKPGLMEYSTSRTHVISKQQRPRHPGAHMHSPAWAS